MRAPLLFAVALAAVPALAHNAPSGWAYDPWCCNRRDCAEIPDDAVAAGPDGWIVVLRRGQHPMITQPMVRHVVPFSQARRSPDGKFHACLYPSEFNMRCFYAPPMGF